MKTLVTGATGLLGNNLVRLLIDRGHQVRVLIRPNSDPRPLQGLSVETQYGQLSGEDSVQAAFSDVDWVFHCAGYVKIGWTELSTARDVNVEGTRRIAAAARHQAARLVYVSTINTLGLGTRNQAADESTPISKQQVGCAYVISKTEAEQVVHDEIAKGLDAVIVHPGFMLGPWDWKPSSGEMLLEVLSRRPPMAPSGGCSVADVRDVAQGTLAAAEQGQTGEHYILAGHNTSYLELWRRFAQLRGRKGPFGKLGPAMRWIIGGGGDLAGRMRGQEGNVNSAMVRMGAQYHYYCSDKAKSELGYQIREMDQTIADAYDWFQQYGYLKP